MNTPAMEKLEGVLPVIESIDCPFEDDFSDASTDVYYKAEEEPEIEVDADTASGEDFVFGVECNRNGIYDLILEGSSPLEPLAQLPVTVFIPGIPFPPPAKP